MAGNNSVTAEVTLEKLLKDIESLESIIAGWDEHERITITALKRAIDDLNKEAMARLIRGLKKSPEAMAALKEAIGDEIVYSVLRHHELVKPSLQERIEQALDSVRPMLQGHGGNVELVSVEPPSKATVRLIGACSGCPASELTLSEGVEKAIKEQCPEITEIVKAKGICTTDTPVNFVSPFARGMEKVWLFAANFDELRENELVVREVGGQSVILARLENNVVCYQNACAHLGMPLDMSELKDGVLTCSYHAFEYLIKSGECLTVPEVQLQTHAVRVMDNRVEVSLS
ncbi:MAG: NifU family protein [Candidatus Melainabacteria bacterium]|nr:NifU family protein [Candidatus Melainabacteria bacterium]